jgi:hypothetical protein
MENEVVTSGDSLDFVRDWREHLKTELKASGYPSQGVSDSDIPLCYFNLLRRMVNPVPRTILKSREFTCPAPLLAGLALVESKIVRGENLQPHLSRKLLKPFFNDGMLNDWGIHHLHLGDVVEPDGFAKRSEPVLFVRFDESTAYLIDTRKHGAWTEQECLRILHRNWPASIQQYKREGLTGEQLSDDTLKVVRSKNLNVALDVDGVAYMGMGGGVVASGAAISVRVQIDRHIIRLQGLQDWCRSNRDVLALEAEKAGRTLPPEFSLKLTIVNGDAIVTEPTAGVAFNLGQL